MSGVLRLFNFVYQKHHHLFYFKDHFADETGFDSSLSALFFYLFQNRTTDQTPILLPNQQRQSTKGSKKYSLQ